MSNSLTNILFNKNIINNWKFYTISTAFLFGSGSLLRKYLFVLNCSFDYITVLFCGFTGLILFLFSIYYYLNNVKIPIKNVKHKYKIITITFLSALVTFIGILFKNYAYFLVDNNAKVEALMEPIKILFVFLISVLFLAGKWSKNTIFGIFFAICSIYFMSK
tara:strand:- start:2211 stop:2696 length:486 start_codon:yes stop_codon:yes gene_type:complete